MLSVRRSEVRVQRSEVGGSEVRRFGGSEVRVQRSEVGGRRSEVRRSGFRGPRSEVQGLWVLTSDF